MTGVRSVAEKYGAALAHIATALPLFSVSAILFSLVYVEGFFSRLGRQWLSALTLQDMFALTWAMLPMYALATLFSFIAIPFLLRLLRLKPRPARDIDDLTALPFYIPLNIICCAIMVACALLFRHTIHAPLNSFTKPITLAIPLIMILPVVIVVTLNIPNQRLAYMTGGAILSIIMTFTFGAAEAMEVIQSNKNTLVRYSTHIFCGKYLLQSERGLLVYNPTYDSVRLIRNDRITSIERPVQCALQQRWHPKKPQVKKPMQPPRHP